MNSKSQIISFLALFEVLNFDFKKFERLRIAKSSLNTELEPRKLSKLPFLSLKKCWIWFHGKSEQQKSSWIFPQCSVLPFRFYVKLIFHISYSPKLISRKIILFWGLLQHHAKLTLISRIFFLCRIRGQYTNYSKS